MSQPNSTRRPCDPADHLVELTARFTVPRAFGDDHVDQLASLLTRCVAGVGQGVYDDYGPNDESVYDGAYICAASAECRVVGRPGALHAHDADWGHGDRCTCHHAQIDHECPESPYDPPGRCFTKGCGCCRYQRLQERV